MNVDNCPRCGKIFVKNYKDVCPACIKDIEQQYEACYHFLRENRKANLQELHEGTKVSYKQIIKFIKEGRISIYDMPNMTYPCEVCGTMIREHTMCDSCRKRLVSDIHHTMSDDRLAQDKNNGGFNIQDRLKNRLN
ncbi:TIGR03826 family flagellar region protein [Paenibacillus sp. J2TS4]|uniref:TIGR03826 family flagellar region protein n=1 Tax=Paenibacillus sp. J2TS4 TaxID=2807194 RepID=UPI001BCF58F5|nr:TIGR03826 family flagellar region protein [Paenibacillus sp. J2TS4]